MPTLPEIIVNSGLIPETTLQEMRRWGCVVPEADKLTATPSSADLLQQIDQAVQEAGYVLTRETDLDSLRYFTQNIRRGTLHLDDGGEPTVISEVNYAVMPTGEYLFPWPTDDMAEVLTNGSSHLQTNDNGHTAKVFFNDGRDLFFGTERAFLMMRVSTKESGDVLE